jgi:hypothetical protein
VQRDPLVVGEPGFHGRVFVGAVVVAHDVQGRAGVGAGDLFEEGEELGMGVPVAAVLGGDFAGGDLQCGEQGGGAIADVVVAGLLRQSGPQRQDRCGAIQRLDL